MRSDHLSPLRSNSRATPAGRGKSTVSHAPFSRHYFVRIENISIRRVLYVNFKSAFHYWVWYCVSLFRNNPQSCLFKGVKILSFNVWKSVINQLIPIHCTLPSTCRVSFMLPNRRLNFKHWSSLVTRVCFYRKCPQKTRLTTRSQHP